MQILHFVGEFGSGGEEKYISLLQKNLENKGYKFTILDTYGKGSPYSKIIEECGGKIILINPRKYADNIRRTIVSIRNIYKIAKTGEYGVLVFHIAAPSFNSLCALAARMGGIKKIIFHAHCGAPMDIRLSRRLVAPFFRKLIELLGCDFIACSECAAEWNYTRRIIDNNDVTIAYYGIEIEKFIFNIKERKKFRYELALENAFVVGTVGRFVEQKNPLYLVEIFKALHDICEEAKLLWIGEGPLESDVCNQINKYGLNDSVILYGITNEVGKLMSAMDVFLLPSLYEGFVIVNIEAQTNGLNCFLSDSITEESRITNLAHYISLDLSPEEWAKYILDYRNETSIRNNFCNSEITAKAYAVQNAGFSIDNNVSKIAEIYEKWI